MNAQFHKVIFSKRLGALVAVGEHASAQGKSASGEGARGALLAAAVFMAGLSTAYALDPSALPSGHQVAAGQVQVTTSGARMDIGQFTDKAIVNWQNFNVGSGASVQIHQPSASSVLLNRVVGNEMSQIRGQISANGQVVLVNPNGIVMGPTGRITASAFTASTFGISDTNFQDGHMHFERNGSNASVVNEGSIQTTGEAGGYVALIGASVSNQGAIASQGAGVALASGERATVSVPLSGKVRLELDPAAFGSASVANSGVIQTEGGQVLLRAAAVVDAVSKVAAAKVTHTGTIDTTGTQGGRVDILADHGTVRVSGNVKANSTSGAAGGDVYIGRDEHTNVLAAVGDASGATLESKGGFVETSGQVLKVNGISVKAKDWLLDPTDIRIVASNTATQDTAQSTSGNTTTFQDSTAVDVTEVHKATIEAAINNGTNVTITTANAPGSGAGNITIETALSFNNTGAQAATLSLLARNGITQNSGASITATGTQAVNILMEALGLWGGQDVDHVSSQGITLNSTITTNGTVTLTGHSRNTSGVQTSEPFAWGATNGSRSGIVFNGGSGITADNFQITGTHHVAAGNSFGVNGVYMSGAVNLVTTGNTNSTITGNSNAQGNFGAGVMVMDGATVRLENQGTGVTTLRGSNTHTGGGNGVRIGATNNNAVINAVGRVTIGQQTTGVNAPTFIRGTLNASLNTSNLGGLTILGQTGSGLTTTAVQLWDTTINAAGIDVTINGVSGNASGVYVQNGGNTTWTTRNLSVTGVANTTAGSSGAGVVIQRFPNVLAVNASGNISIQGTVQGAGNGRGIHFADSGWGPQAPSLTATGNITLRGNSRGAQTNTEAIRIASGVQVNAGGNIVLQAETSNENTNAIHALSGANAATTWAAAATAGTGALFGNMSLKSSGGDVLIQSNRGGIRLDNLLNSTLVNGSQTTSTEISGRNITIDNTGAGMATGVGNTAGSGGTTGATIGSGSINASTGAITKGTGRANNTLNGVHLDARTMTASGNVNIYGVVLPNPGGGSGYGVQSSATISAANFSIQGEGINTGAWLAGGGAVRINNGSTITGTATSGTNLIKGTWESAYGNNFAVVLGSAANSNISISSAAGSTLNIEGRHDGNQTNITGQWDSSGVLAQGTVTTQGTVNITGHAESNDGISMGGTFNHAGGTLTLDGTSETDRPVQSSAAGVRVHGSLNITDSSALTIRGTYTAKGDPNSNGSQAIGFTNTGAITGQGGQLSITGASTLRNTQTFDATNPARSIGVFVDGALTGWGHTTLSASNDARSVAPAVQVMRNINVGSNRLNIQATNGGQIFQGASSTLTAARVSIDNTNGTIDPTTGLITVGAATSTTGSSSRAVDLNGAVTASGNINLTANASAYINSTLTTSDGDIRLQATHTGANGHGLDIRKNVTASNGDVYLTGSTASTTATTAGVFSSATVTGRNITMVATANSTNADGRTLGYYGAAGRFEASGSLNLTGSSNNNGNGFYTFGGSLTAGTGMVINGTSTKGQGMGFDQQGNGGNLVQIVNSSSGGIEIRGNAMADGQQGVNLNGVSIVNNGTGDIDIWTLNGHIDATNTFGGTNNITNGANGGEIILEAGVGAVNPENSSSRINGTHLSIIQNSNGGVFMGTPGNGDVTVAKIVNDGTGDVEIMAGYDKLEGDGTGGQIKTVAGNTISNTNGTTRLYSGAADRTGSLSLLDTNLANLYLSDVEGNRKNTQFNSEAGDTMTSAAPVQVFFREASNIGKGTLNGAVLEKTYGDARTQNGQGAALLADMVTKLKEVNSGNQEQSTNAGQLIIAKSALVDDLAAANQNVALTNPLYSGSGFLRANAGGYSNTPINSGAGFGTSLEAGQTTKVIVNKRALNVSGLTAQDKAFDTNTAAQLTGNANLLEKVGNDDIRLSGLTGNFDSPDVGNNKPVALSGSLDGSDKDNYTLILPTNLSANITGAVEPIDPPTPVVPVVPPTNNNVVVTVAAANNNFVLAGAEGQCSADTLEQCECEKATDTAGAAIDGIQICYEPKGRAAGAPL